MVRRSGWIIGLVGVSACGYPVATHCDSSVFGQGVDSTLPVDCGVIDQDAQLAGALVASHTAISEAQWLAAMQHVHVRVRSTIAWNESGESADGDTSLNQIATDSLGLSLAHETLHAYDAVSDVSNIASFFALPVEAAQEHNHTGWTEKHYWDADTAYQLGFCPLAPGLWHVKAPAVQGCVQEAP
jgi:hypothetical protein